MNKTIKNTWVKALRSGKYKQGMGHLCHGGPQGVRYCCLGVLSDIAVKQGVCSRREAFAGNKVLNEVIIDWAGLNSHKEGGEDPIVDGESLASRNDDHGQSFKEIADAIQKHL